MKSIVILLFFNIFSTISAYTQDMLITFASAADSITIDSVKAVNLRTNQVINIAGDEVLILRDTNIVGVNSNLHSPSSVLYPNPCIESITLKVNTNIAQRISVKIANPLGQIVLQSSANALPGIQMFYVSCADEGIYLATIQKSNGTESMWFIQKNKGSNSIFTGANGYEPSNSQISNNVENNRLLKGATITNTNLMGYKSDDILLLTFYSGVNQTIVTTSPTASTIITAEFLKCIDADNNSYPVVKIGDQWWMAKNLTTTHYNNGDPIPTDIVDSVWVELKTGAYSCYLKNPEYIPNYGLLYNWFAASENRGVCPVGWHLSSSEEWEVLLNYLGGEENAGGELKATGTDFWLEPNFGATNSTGFSALPSSGRNIDGVLYNDGHDCFYWLSNERDTTYAYNRYIYYNRTLVTKVFHTKIDGFAVRCVKDE